MTVLADGVFDRNKNVGNPVEMALGEKMIPAAITKVVAPRGKKE